MLRSAGVRSNRLKEALSTLLLQIPDFSSKFTLVCDASNVAISAVLHRKKGENLPPVAYGSRLLSPANRRYSIHEKERLAVVYGCKRYHSHLQHKEFCSIRTTRPWPGCYALPKNYVGLDGGSCISPRLSLRSATSVERLTWWLIALPGNMKIFQPMLLLRG
jgi:hypothetical protein